MNRRNYIKTIGYAGMGTILLPNQPFFAQAPKNYILNIDPKWEKSTPFKHTWKGLGNVDQLRWIERGDMQSQLVMAKQELGLRHVRAVGLFDEDLYALSIDPALFFSKDKVAKSTPRINWRTPLYIYDRLVELGLSPVVTPCFMPNEMASGTKTVFQTKNNVTPPKDWKDWEALLKNFIGTLVDRYGIDTLKTWYFEAWNEPNLDGFWTGGQEGYWKLYQILNDTIKNIDPALKIGGPSTARGEWIEEILLYGEKNNCIPDYIIGHCYNNDSANAPLSPFEGPQKDKENKSPNFTSGVVRGIKKIMNDYNYKGEFHMNEWGLSWHPFNPVRETANEAAFIVKTMNEVSQEADYFAYWCLSDIYNQVGYGLETFHGNYGMLTMEGLRKQNYHAHQLLTRLGNQKIEIEALGAADGQASAIITQSAKGIQALCYAFNIAYQAGNEPGKCQVSIALPKQINPATAKIYRLDNDHNNVMNAWKAMGSPAIPTQAQLNQLKAQNELTSESATNLLTKSKNGYVAQFDMPNPGVVLLEITKR